MQRSASTCSGGGLGDSALLESPVPVAAKLVISESDLGGTRFRPALISVTPSGCAQDERRDEARCYLSSPHSAPARLSESGLLKI